MHVIPDPTRPPFEQNAVAGIRSEPPPAQPLNLGTALAAILEQAGVDDFLEPAERKQLAALDGEWGELNSRLTETTHASIRARFRELMDAGKPEIQATLEQRASLMRQSLKAKMRSVTTQAVPIAIAGSRRLADIAESVASDLEPQEKDEAQRLGFDFVPSPLLKAAKHFVHYGRTFEPFPTASCRPSHILPWSFE